MNEQDYAAAIRENSERLRELNERLDALIADQKRHMRSAGRTVAKGLNKAASSAKASRR